MANVSKDAPRIVFAARGRLLSTPPPAPGILRPFLSHPFLSFPAKAGTQRSQNAALDGSGPRLSSGKRSLFIDTSLSSFPRRREPRAVKRRALPSLGPRLRGDDEEGVGALMYFHQAQTPLILRSEPLANVSKDAPRIVFAARGRLLSAPPPAPGIL